MTNQFEWLQQFFLSNCNGEWEHSYGCKIDTMSDPGWFFQFDLMETQHAGKFLEPLEDQSSALVWLRCKLEDGVFTAQCSPRRLGECIEILRDVVEGRRGMTKERSMRDDN